MLSLLGQRAIGNWQRIYTLLPYPLWQVSTSATFDFLADNSQLRIQIGVPGILNHHPTPSPPSEPWVLSLYLKPIFCSGKDFILLINLKFSCNFLSLKYFVSSLGSSVHVKKKIFPYLPDEIHISAIATL